MRTENLEQGVSVSFSGPSFLATKYIMARIEFPTPGASGEILNVPLVGFEKQGQIINMRMTAESGNATFTLHSTPTLAEADPFGIVLQSTLEDEKDAATNELWTQWNVTSSAKDEPYLWVSYQDTGATKGRCRIELILAN